MTQLETMVLRVAESVRRRFVRKRLPADPVDVYQDAALAGLEAARAGYLDGLPPEHLKNRLRRIARVEASLAASRALSPVTLSEHAAATRSIEYRPARAARREDGEDQQVVETLPSTLPGPAEALDEALEAREARGREEAAERALARLEPREARVVVLLAGLRGEAPAAGGPAEVAFRLGVSRRAVARAVHRFGREVERERVTSEPT